MAPTAEPGCGNKSVLPLLLISKEQWDKARLGVRSFALSAATSEDPLLPLLPDEFSMIMLLYHVAF